MWNNEGFSKSCLFTAYNHGNLVGVLAVYFNEAREAMGEAVAKKNTYNPVSELPI